MELLLIAGAVLMVLAPLSNFFPSKRQRREANLRQTAAQAGLFVEFRDLPGNRAPADPDAGQVIYYGLRLAPSQARGRRRQAWWRRDGHWEPLPAAGPAPEALERCPEGVLAASIDEGSCGLYWQERGDAAMVQAMGQLLAQWRDSLARR